eukprot:292056-Pleurochrysis_carterae.AAC.1
MFSERFTELGTSRAAVSRWNIPCADTRSRRFRRDRSVLALLRHNDDLKFGNISYSAADHVRAVTDDEKAGATPRSVECAEPSQPGAGRIGDPRGSSSRPLAPTAASPAPSAAARQQRRRARPHSQSTTHSCGDRQGARLAWARQGFWTLRLLLLSG